MNQNKLKAKIVENGLTQKDIAIKLGLSIGAFNQKLNGKYNFTLPEVAYMSKKLKLKPKERDEIFFD